VAREVADVTWEMLAKAGVTRCYGIVGDALNPVIGPRVFFRGIRRVREVFLAIENTQFSLCAFADSLPSTNGAQHSFPEGAPAINSLLAQVRHYIDRFRLFSALR
jgi:hypothetical protein